MSKLLVLAELHESFDFAAKRGAEHIVGHLQGHLCALYAFGDSGQHDTTLRNEMTLLRAFAIAILENNLTSEQFQ